MSADVADTGTAVDQDVVVVPLQVRADRVEELAAAEPVEEVVPVEVADDRRVRPVLAAAETKSSVPPSGKSQLRETACWCRRA